MSAILHVEPLSFPWVAHDPFLFCVFHDDRYPAANESLGPAASLAGRDLGQDFTGPVTDEAGWRMYHGTTVPGFPQHPHRGFETLNRTLYFFRGDTLSIDGHSIDVNHSVRVKSDSSLTIENGERESELLVLQGRPIDEPIAQYGPFVMNTREEIQQAFADYRRTEFGGWPWPKDDPVHPRDEGRFARHPGSSAIERP